LVPILITGSDYNRLTTCRLGTKEEFSEAYSNPIGG
jgi:hypothetical protein